MGSRKVVPKIKQTHCVEDMYMDKKWQTVCFMETPSVTPHIVDELVEAHWFAAALWSLWGACRPNVETCHWMANISAGAV